MTVTELPTTATFWECRESLTRILEFARSRRAGPWAVLAAVLARAVASVEPNVKLPPTVGAAASLNLFVAVVGPSGGGKGAAEGAARDAVQFVDHTGRPLDDLAEFPVGSGEGIARTFRPAGADADEANERTRALFTIPEVDTIAALGSRQGATLMPELRKLYMGEQLGFANGAKATRSTLPAHSYRASLVVGVQPLRAAALLHDADGGTPQRFVWVPVGDPDAPDVAPSPQPLIVRLPRWETKTVYLEVPEMARAAMDAHRLATLRGEAVDPLDGHRMLTRLKIAAALMILDGRTVVDDEDWMLAGVVMRVSDRTRAGIERDLEEKARRSNRARAEARAEAEGIVADRAAERLRERARGRIVRTLERRGTETRKGLRNNLDTPLRGVFDAVLSDLLEGAVIRESGGKFELVGVGG